MSWLFSAVWISTVKNRWKRTKRPSDKYKSPNIIARKKEGRKTERERNGRAMPIVEGFL